MAPTHPLAEAERRSGRKSRLTVVWEGELSVGDRVVVDAGPERGHFAIGAGASLKIGDRTIFGQGVSVAATDRIEFGSDNSIGAFCMVADSDFHAISDHLELPEPRPVLIGDRVSIGPWTVVLPGSRIGDDVVVHPGSVVAGLIAPNSVVGGVPARPVDSSGGASGLGEIVQWLFDLEAEPPPTLRTETVGGWDSLGALRLMIAIEDAFGVRLDESRLGELDTMADWSDLLEDALR